MSRAASSAPLSRSVWPSCLRIVCQMSAGSSAGAAAAPDPGEAPAAVCVRCRVAANKIPVPTSDVCWIPAEYDATQMELQSLGIIQLRDYPAC